MIELLVTTPNLDKFSLDMDMESLLDESAALLLNRILTRFLAETDPQGRPWIPSRAGINRRASGGGGTLFDTGRLFRSIQVHKEEGQRRISTDVPYARQHNFGENGMIPRPFLGFSQSDEELVHSLVDLRIKQALG